MILRVKHDSNYTILSNDMLTDKRLSFKARGLLAFMLTMPDDWKFYTDELEEHSHDDGHFSVDAAIQELVEAGYIARRKVKGDDGRWKTMDWEIRETSTPAVGKPAAVLPAADKPRPGKPAAVLPAAGNHQLPRTNIPRTKEPRTNGPRTKLTKGGAGTAPFDALDLPVHLGKHPAVVKAWAEFVLHRKELGHRITPTAWKRTITKMLPRSPQEIVAAIDKSIECDWRGLFFREEPTAHPHRIIHGREAAPVLDSTGHKLLSFVTSVLGSTSVSTSTVADLTDRMKTYYRSLPHDPNSEDRGPTRHLSEEDFFNRWLEFLKGKQRSGFTLQSLKQLAQDGVRWNEFIRDCERYTHYNFSTGAYLG